MARAPSGGVKELRISSTMTVGRASLLMAGMIALSRITGFGRLVLTSYLYGVGPITDAYNAAFNIPDTITILIAGGALATGFVPVFTELLAQDKQEEARRTFRAMFSLLLVVFGIVTLALFVFTFTPWGAALAPRRVTPPVVHLYLYMLRILLLAQFFYVMGGICTGTLNALRLFWYPALQPVVFNGGIIVFGLLLPRLGDHGIESQAWGALAGAIVGSALIQVPAVLRSGLSLQPLWNLDDPGVRRVLRSLLPIVFGLASGQIVALNLPRFFAVGLHHGDLTLLDNANRLMQVPLDLLASGPAVALFPTLSLLAAQGKPDEVRVQLAGALRRTLLLTLLATALAAALALPAVRLLLEHGRFVWHNSVLTGRVLVCYAFCLVGLGAQQMLARGFYATNDTRTPVVIGVRTVLLFCFLASLAVFVVPSGPRGLALCAAVAISFLAVSMWLALRHKLGGWDEGRTELLMLRGTVAALVAYCGAWVVAINGMHWTGRHGLDTPHSQVLVKLLARITVLSGGAVVGTLLFCGACAVMQVPEVEAIQQRLRLSGRQRRA